MCLFVLKIHTATIKSSKWLFDYFFWILFYINKHNRQIYTMMWQGSGILAPRDDIKWRKRKVILHKSCPIGNGGSTPPIIAKHCGVEQLVACQAHNLEVVGSSPTPATKNTKYFHKYLDISNFFVIFVLLSSLISFKKYKGGFLILPVSFGRKEKDNQWIHKLGKSVDYSMVLLAESYDSL